MTHRVGRVEREQVIGEKRGEVQIVGEQPLAIVSQSPQQREAQGALYQASVRDLSCGLIESHQRGTLTASSDAIESPSPVRRGPVDSNRPRMHCPESRWRTHKYNHQT